jgi:hypothetical protein
MKLFVYPIVSDTNFAPHVDPKGKYLTLATCKPRVRRNAKRGDWVMAVTGKTTDKKVEQGKVVCIFEITEKPKTYDAYWRDPRFKGRDDNIYYVKNGTLMQKEGSIAHSKRDEQEHDWSGEYVLISNNFCYFGKDGSHLRDLGFEEFIPCWRDYRYNFDPRRVSELIEHFKRVRRNCKSALQGTPIHKRTCK